MAEATEVTGPTLGELLPDNALLLRQEVGALRSEDGTTLYEISTTLCGRQPLIRCIETGRWWTISWNDLLSLALEAGIARPQLEEVKRD